MKKNIICNLKNTHALVGMITVCSLLFILPVFAQMTFKDTNSNNELRETSGLLHISDINSRVESNDAVITWNANNLALGRVYFGSVHPVTISKEVTWINASNYGNYANSKANLKFLDRNTTYYYKIMLIDSSGNIAISKEASFKTKR